MIMPYHVTIMTLINLSNRTRNLRLKLGLTQAQLAEKAGISRTGVTAVENNKLVPSVAVALAIAKVLDTTVEHLFGSSDSDEDADARKSEVWALAPSLGSKVCWYAEVRGRTILVPALSVSAPAFPPDRIVDSPSINNVRSRAEKTLVVASCDPAAGMLASYFHSTTGMRLLPMTRSSSQAIEMLRDGLVHMAGIHYSTVDQPDRNSHYIKEQLGSGFEVVRVARWKEGIAVRTNCGIRSVRAATNAKLTWIGREPGSGARQCLDQLLKNRRTPRFIASNHRGVAESIKSGYADAGVCLQLACAEAGLDFIPVQVEAYDICFPSEIAGDRRIQGLISTLRSKNYRNLLNELPGYDSSETGNSWLVN